MFNGKYFDWNQKRVKEIVNHYGHKFMYQKKVLDLGCGYGDIGGTLYRLGADITAVDARQDHLNMVVKKFPGIKVVKADLDREWPFQGKFYDLILDLGLMCHLSNFESHLRAVCASCKHLILETAVCDSKDPNRCLQNPENKGVYDLSVNGMGCRPSPAAIERVLQECGMTFNRMDSSKFNSGNIVYDWQPKDDSSTSIDKRRIWFCVREGHIQVSPAPVPQLQSAPQLYNSHIPVRLQTTASPMPPPPPPAPPRNIIHSNIGHHATFTVGNFAQMNEDVKLTTKKFAITPGAPLPQFPNLRVLYLPLNDADNVQQGMYDAWKNVGVTWDVFDFYRRWLSTRGKAQLQTDMIQKVKEFQPHLIHMQLQFTGLIDSSTIEQCRKAAPGVVITNWSGDIRKEAILDFTIMSRVVDFSLISSTGQLDMYRRGGCQNVRYWQIGFDPNFIYPMRKNEFRYDCSFTGNCYPNSSFPDAATRANAMIQVYNSFPGRVGLFGAGYGIHGVHQCAPKDINGIYNDSVCPISISNFNNISHYFSDRLLACVASGRPTISWYFPGIEDYFQAGSEIYVARSGQDIIDTVKFCKENMETANAVGEAGYKKALAEHTFTSRVLELLAMTNLVRVPTNDTTVL